MPEMGSDIGAMLRETRMRARIDIGEVEMRTKIRAKYLRAMENEEWELLPGPVYVKSFLRTYGEYLGLDSRLLVDEYKRRYELAPDAQHRPLSAVKRERERERERASRGPRAPAVPSWLIIAVVLLCAGAALYLIGRGGGSSSTKGTTGTTGVASVVPPVTTQSTPHKPTPAHKTVVVHKATLKIVPTADDWVCVENAAGKLLIPGVVYSVGETVPRSSAGILLVGLGNNSATITIDGKPYTPTASSAIALKITPTKVSTLSAVPSACT
jgi:cytoskeleton protein RodZ